MLSCLVFGRQESLKLSIYQGWEWHSALILNNRTAFNVVKRGKAFVPMKYSKIQASGSNTKGRPTSRYNHMSERFLRIASNEDSKNFFYVEIRFERMFCSVTDTWTAVPQALCFVERMCKVSEPTFCAEVKCLCKCGTWVQVLHEHLLHFFS